MHLAEENIGNRAGGCSLQIDVDHESQGDALQRSLNVYTEACETTKADYMTWFQNLGTSVN